MAFSADVCCVGSFSDFYLFGAFWDERAKLLSYLHNESPESAKKQLSAWVGLVYGCLSF